MTWLKRIFRDGFQPSLLLFRVFLILNSSVRCLWLIVWIKLSLNHYSLILAHSVNQLSDLFIPLLDLVLQLHSTLSIVVTLLTKHLLHLKYLNPQRIPLFFESLDFSTFSFGMRLLLFQDSVDLLNFCMFMIKYLSMLFFNLLPPSCCLIHSQLHLVFNFIWFSLSFDKLML